MHEDTLLAYQLSTKTEQGIVSSHKDGELEKTHSVHLLAMMVMVCNCKLRNREQICPLDSVLFLLIYSYIHHKWLLSSSHRSIQGLEVKMDMESSDL